jgi:hypothetical protein
MRHAVCDCRGGRAIRRDHALKAFKRFTGTKNLVAIPNITHYGIYFEAHRQAQTLALEWFDKNLKP